MRNFRLIFSLAALMFVVASCSKEKRVERKLWKDGGEWNITKYTFTEGNTIYGEGVANAGTLVFSKNGSLVWTETIEDTQVYNCTWSNSKDEITIVRDGETYVFRIDIEKKDEMQLVTSKKYVEDGYTYDYYLTMKIEKK